MRRPLVSIIVATLNTPRLTQACLSTVVKNTAVPYELIVVNNSRARPIQDCIRKFKGIRIIQNPKNLGYTKAANQGARAAQGQFLCFLNSDTLVPAGWIERLLEVSGKPDVGAVGPTHQLYGYQWSIWDLTTREAMTNFIDRAIQHRYSGNSAEEISWLCGFCLVISKSVMCRVGFFDERFFFGYEDMDYSLQLRIRGYRLLQVKSVFVHHLFGGSSTNPEKRRRWIKEAGRQFLAKWRSCLGLPSADYQEVCAAVDRPFVAERVRLSGLVFGGRPVRHYKKMNSV